jgi:molybdopterin-containing oxidoreductase family iron-sulfur binding subunit
MKIDRRKFIAGISALAIAVITKPALNIFRLKTVQASRPATTNKNTRWAMVIDLHACESPGGCRACIEACHSIHNVPSFSNPKDEIKWIWTVPYEQSFPEQEHSYNSEYLHNKPSLILCNHCDNPPCVSVCPTKATWQRADGVVMMDYHRCIGCRYCMAACPYGARSFNWWDPRPYIENIDIDFPTRSKGVVEKCNFCQERLEEGLQPACVEACTHKGLVFGDLDDPDSEVRAILGSSYTIQRKPGLGTRPQVYYRV